MNPTTPHAPPPMPWSSLAAVLIGFPALFFVWSQALLHRDAFTFGEIDFFVTFWLGTSLIYALKIAVVLWIVRRTGWTPADLGLRGVDARSVGRWTAIYVLLAAITFVAVEWAVANSTFDAAKVAALPGLYPETSAKRIMLLVMAFFAGISEELTYRAFAISGLVSRGINRWVAILFAAIPFVFQHGLKSLDQFWWFFINGLVFGVIYVLSRRLMPGIVLHWLIIWTALFGIFSALA